LCAAAIRAENATLLEPVLEKREAAVLHSGSAAKANAFAQVLITLANTAPELFASLEDHDSLLHDGIKYIDFALQAEAAFGESKMRESLYLAKAELLWFLGKTDSAFKEYRACLKEDVNERVTKSWFPKLASLGRENEIDNLCRDFYPRAKNKSQQDLLLRAFYNYTTLSTKAAYEWADPQEVDKFVEEERRQGRDRTTLWRRTGEHRAELVEYSTSSINASSLHLQAEVDRKRTSAPPPMLHTQGREGEE